MEPLLPLVPWASSLRRREKFRACWFLEEEAEEGEEEVVRAWWGRQSCTADG